MEGERRRGQRKSYTACCNDMLHNLARQMPYGRRGSVTEKREVQKKKGGGGTTASDPLIFITLRRTFD